MTATGFAALAVALLEAALLVWGPARVPGALSYLDLLYAALLAFCGISGVAWARPRRVAGRVLSEGLLFATVVLFLFGYIYAANANMDYVQRLATSGGNVRLAPDTRTERLIVSVRFLPILAAALVRWLLEGRAGREPRALDRWGLPLCLLASAAMALSYPSFVSSTGMGPLAFVAYAPLFAVLSAVRYGRALFYGTAAWTVQTMLTNYWLGTYSLISLQLVTVLLALEGLAFFAVAVGAHRLVARRAPAAAFVVFPLAWTVFDYLRTVGFAGYPWGLAGATQERFLPLLQLASVTGVWGVGYVVLLVASALASAVAPGPLSRRARIAAVLSAGGLLAVTVALGAVAMTRPAPPALDTVRLALVQQNNDPRKNDYEETFRTLQRLTDEALAARPGAARPGAARPDLVVWSETAFVPNIRRWSALDPAAYPLADLVQRFLAYQKGSATWLLTGNDDYELRTEGGEEVRLDYNAAILFSASGTRAQTYHKMRLVPFTESFPWKRQLPTLHKLLLSFDVYLWEPGAERVVFRHPRFSFCTPICFEDAFPDHVRRFVREGLDVIVNISNDYWSLTEVEARQHAANAVFRAVENRRPVVRATASGETVYIDTSGRRVASLPCYVEGTLIVDVPLSGRPATVYSRWGDWFPAACAVAVAALAGVCALGNRAARRRRGQPPAAGGDRSAGDC